MPPQTLQKTAMIPQSNPATSVVQGTYNYGIPTSSLTTISTSQQSVKSSLTGNSKCLLKAAIATIATSIHQATTHILFDEGSQWSFILQSLVDEMGL